jgi:hypothetical protein
VTMASPSLNDFNVSRGKFLNDKETDLKRKHAVLLDVSKNGVVQNKTHPKRKRTRKTVSKQSSKLCTLCSTCTCSRGSALQSLEDSATSEYQNPLQKLARSDAEVERALIGRLARLEKSASWFDHLCSKVSKELTRHRNKIKARMRQGNGESRPKFLKDVGDDDDKQFSSAPALSKSFVNRAKHQIFSFRKSEFGSISLIFKLLQQNNNSHRNPQHSQSDIRRSPAYFDTNAERIRPRGF